MKVLIDIGHPGHVHLLKNLYHQLLLHKHEIWVTVKNIPVAISLLEKYRIKYIEIGKKNDSLFGKAFSQVSYNIKVLNIVRRNDISIGIGSSITIAHVSRLSKMKSILLDDDDDDVQPLFVKYAHPFFDTILSPESLVGHRKSNKALFYSGFHELAYLHPNWFEPDVRVLEEAGIAEGEKYFVLRFNVFKAHHDIGVKGMTTAQKLKLINILEPYGRVFITTERSIEPELKKFQMLISPEKVHSFIYYATMFLGDSQTMTSESAILGTPALRMNSFVGRIAYLEEEEHKYGLTFGFKPDEFDKMIEKIKILIQVGDLKGEWKHRRDKLLSEKIDVTSFLFWFVENYPKSVSILRENPNYPKKFT